MQAPTAMARTAPNEKRPVPDHRAHGEQDRDRGQGQAELLREHDEEQHHRPLAGEEFHFRIVLAGRVWSGIDGGSVLPADFPLLS